MLHEQDQSERKRPNPLLLAHEMKEVLDSGEVQSRAEIAKQYGWSRARVTQIMNLLKLPKEIQVVLLAPKNRNVAVSERALRKVLKAESSEKKKEVLAALGIRMPVELEL